jgi:hypothetical protein
MVAFNNPISAPKAVQKKLLSDDMIGSKVPSKTALKRAELATFLGRSGRGVNCRIDMQILTLEDIKRAAFELNLLAQKLQKIAENTEQNDVLQVLSARHEFTKTKVAVKTFQLTTKEK